MKKLDYLKYAIQQKLYSKKAWMISLFSVFQEGENSWKEDPYKGRLVTQPWGLSFVNESGELEKIDDSKQMTPLFTPADRLMIDNSWASNCKESVETSVGTLLFNHICLITCFGNKLDYMVGRISVAQVEAEIVPRLKSNPKPGEARNDVDIYVDEYIALGRSFEYLKGMLQLCAYAATPKGLVAPTGIKEFKAQLNRKYEGKLTDPVQMAAYEAELKKFDDEFMKDDPTYGKFTSGKVANISRKKLFLTVGSETGFKETAEIIPVTNSLQEGWPTDPVEYTSMMNGIRTGSYARGAETVNGGVAMKYMLRAANNFKIKSEDCGSKLGIRRLYTKANASSLVGRTLIDAGKQILVENENQLGNYLGKVLTVRSPMYCKMEGDTLCKVCTGEKLGRYETGLTIPLTEISSILLAASMAKMHTSGLSSAEMDLSEILS